MYTLGEQWHRVESGLVRNVEVSGLEGRHLGDIHLIRT